MLSRLRFHLLPLLVFLSTSSRSALAGPVIGVLGIAEEVAPIEQLLQDRHETTVQGYVFRAGTLNGRQVVVGRSGAGKVNAAIVATLLIGHFKPSAVFFSGTAGAVDPALRPCDVVIGATVAQHDVGLQTPKGIVRRGLRNAVTGELDPVLVAAPEVLLAAARRSASGIALPPCKASEGERMPRIAEGVIVTGDVFMTDVARRDEIRKSLGATAIEMEGAAIIQACRQFGVSCLVVRGITDRADVNAPSSYQEFLDIASRNAATLVVATIARLEFAH